MNITKLKLAAVPKIACGITLAITFALASGSVIPAGAADPPHCTDASVPQSASAENSGQIPAQITKEQGSGYQISLQLKEPPGKNIRGSLLTINGTHLKHKSLSTVKRMLSGPVGTSVDLQILTDNEERKSYIVRRETIGRSSDFNAQEKSAWTAIKTRSSFSGPDQWWMLSAAHTDNEIQNLDLTVRGLKRLAARAAMLLSDGQNPEAYYSLSSASVACDRLGDVDAANEYLKLAISKAGHGVIWIHQPSERKMPLDHFLAVGRYKECKALSERGLVEEKARPKQPFNDNWSRQKAMNLYCVYAEATTQSEDKNASKAVSEYFDFYKQAQPPLMVFSENLIRVGELFNKLGMYDQAIAALQKTGYNVEPDPHIPHPNMYAVSRLNRISYQLAQYQESAGHYADAINTLTATNQIWQDRVSPEDAKNAEELALYFPAPSDILLALARLDLKTKQTTEAIKNANQSIKILRSTFGPNDFSLKEPLLVLAKALRKKGDSAQADKLEIQANRLRQVLQIKDFSELEKARMIRDAISLIKDGKGSEANKIAEQLFNIYQEEGVPANYPLPNVNLFCSILNIARRLSDKQCYEDSDQLIAKLLASVENQERSPEVIPFLIIEKSINADRQHRDTLKEWTDIADSLENKTAPPSTNESGNAIKSLNRQKNLRTIADLYLCAGENSRANLILAKSTHFQTERKHEGDLPGVEVAMEDALLKMDYALFAAEQGASEKAEQLAKEALSECPPRFLTVAVPKDYVFINESDQRQTQNLEFKMQRLVEALLLKNDLETSKNILAEFFKKSSIAFDTHETNNALEPFDEKKDSNKRANDGTFQALMAKILYRQGKPAEALEFINFDVAHERIPLSSFYMLAADIANANNLPGKAAHFYSEAEKSGTYVIFAMDQDNPALHKRLLEKAATLAASDATFDKIEKANIFMRYALVLEPDDKFLSLEYLQQAYELVPDTEQRKADLLDRITRLSAQITLKEFTPAEQSAYDKGLIENRYKSASLAESSGRKDAFRYWLTLADIETQTGNLPDAFKHAEHAILLLHKNCDPINYRAPFSSWSEVTESLAKHNDFQSAEKIYIDAFNKLKSLDGKDSFSSARQGIQLVLFYLKHQRDKDALSVLGQLINDCPRALGIGWPENAISELEQIQPELLRQNRNEVSLQIEQRMLEGNRQTYAADDERIANSLVELAAVEKALSKDELSEAHLNEASKILKLYFFEPENHARKAFEAKLGDLGISGYTKINRFLEQNDELRNYFPIELDSESANIAEVQKHYDHIRISTPYGVAAAGDLDCLIELGSTTRNWEVLANAATARLNIIEHKPDQLAGRQTGCLISNLYRFRYYELAIEANLHLGKKREAGELIARAEANATAPTFHEMCTLSKLACDCGNTAESERLATRAEGLMEDETWQFADLVKVWRALGRENQAVAVEAKAKCIKDAYDSKVQSDHRGAFSDFNI